MAITKTYWGKVRRTVLLNYIFFTDYNSQPHHYLAVVFLQIILTLCKAYLVNYRSINSALLCDVLVVVVYIVVKRWTSGGELCCVPIMLPDYFGQAGRQCTSNNASMYSTR